MDGMIRTIEVSLDNPLDVDSNRGSSDLDPRRQYEAPAIPRKRARTLELKVLYFSHRRGKRGAISHLCVVFLIHKKTWIRQSFMPSQKIHCQTLQKLTLGH
jgi:hypothetical protein